jgi:hypothetical protein
MWFPTLMPPSIHDLMAGDITTTNAWIYPHLAFLLVLKCYIFDYNIFICRLFHSYIVPSVWQMLYSSLKINRWIFQMEGFSNWMLVQVWWISNMSIYSNSAHIQHFTFFVTKQWMHIAQQYNIYVHAVLCYDQTRQF